MTRLQLDQHARALTAWREQQDRLDLAWTGAAFLDDYELDAVLTRWMAAHPDDAGPDTGDLVSVLLDIVPLEEWLPAWRWSCRPAGWTCVRLPHSTRDEAAIAAEEAAATPA